MKPYQSPSTSPAKSGFLISGCAVTMALLMTATGCTSSSTASGPQASSPLLAGTAAATAQAPKVATPLSTTLAQPAPTLNGLLGSPSKSVDIAGGAAPIALADESMLTALPRTNPFASLLIPDEGPKIQAPVLTQAAPINTAPPVDPFAGLQLAGIMYRGNRSSAIIKYGGGSRIIHTGDILRTGTHQIRVFKIEPEALVLRVDGKHNGPANERVRRFTIPSMVGYHHGFNAGGTDTTSSDSTASAGDTGSSAVMSTSQSGTQTALPPDLQALTKYLSGPGKNTQAAAH